MNLELDYPQPYNYHSSDQNYYQVGEQCSYMPEMQGKIKRRSNKTKCHLHPCPSCQCPSDTMEQSLVFSKSDNLDIIKMLNEHERNVSAGLNHRPHSPTIKDCHYRPRRRQSAVPPKSRVCHLEDSTLNAPLSPMMEDIDDSGSLDDDIYDNRQYEFFEQFPKNKPRITRQSHEKRVECNNDVKETNAHGPIENRRLKKKVMPRNPRYPLQKGGSEALANKGPRGDAHCEITVKAGDEETLNIQKSIFAGGDLDVHSMKDHILCLVDRALSNDFSPGLTTEQLKNHRTSKSRGQQAIHIEITQVLQEHKSQAPPETIHSNCEPSDYEKRLKDTLKKRLSHIQDEIEALYKLEDLNLDLNGQSTPVVQATPSNLIKSDADDRQQKTAPQPQRHYENHEAPATS